jgi:hypothetical protein
MLKGLGLNAGEQLKPKILYTDIIEDGGPARRHHQPQPAGFDDPARRNPLICEMVLRFMPPLRVGTKRRRRG